MVGPGDPVQDRSTEHDVERAVPLRCRRELLGRALHEGLVGSGSRPRFVEQRRLRFEPDDVAVRHLRRDQCGEVAGAAADVQHPVVGPEAEAVEERVVVAPVVARVGGVERAVPWRQTVQIMGRTS